MTTEEFLNQSLGEVVAGGLKPIEERISAHVGQLALLRNLHSMVVRGSKRGRQRAPDRSGPRVPKAKKPSISKKKVTEPERNGNSGVGAHKVVANED